jgi:hypothetical protein
MEKQNPEKGDEGREIKPKILTIMREFSPTLPQTTEQQPNGTTKYNYDIEQVDGGYRYSPLYVAGNFTRSNIEYAYLLEFYTPQDIDEIIGVISHSDKPIDIIKTQMFNAIKAMINGFIDSDFGPDFK